MAAACAENGYGHWLGNKLLSVNPEVDTDVFVSYLIGILESDSSLEEKKESILEILEDVVGSDKDQVCDEILRQWEKSQGGQQENDLSHGKQSIDDRLSDLLGKQDLLATTVKTKELSEEDRARREAKEAILAQYSHAASSDESSSDELDPGGASGSVAAENSLSKNSNREDVKKIEQEKREKSKVEHEKKKEKDKLDRDAQKQKKADRKENEKKRTQKGERRR